MWSTSWFLHQNHRSPQIGIQNWCCLTEHPSFSASDFTNLCSNRRNSCSSSSYRSWMRVDSDSSLERYGWYKSARLWMKRNLANMTSPSCKVVHIRLNVLRSLIAFEWSLFKTYLSKLGCSWWWYDNTQSRPMMSSWALCTTNLINWQSNFLFTYSHINCWELLKNSSNSTHNFMGFMGPLHKLWDEMGQYFEIWDLFPDGSLGPHAFIANSNSSSR